MRDFPITLASKFVKELESLKGSTSLEAVSKRVILEAAYNKEVMASLSCFYRKGLCCEDTAWIGHLKVPTYKPLLGDTRFGKRIHVKLNDAEWLQCSQFADALDAPMSHTLALLLITQLEVSRHGIA